jgi:hypothetical protein
MVNGVGVGYASSIMAISVDHRVGLGHIRRPSRRSGTAHRPLAMGKRTESQIVHKDFYR